MSIHKDLKEAIYYVIATLILYVLVVLFYLLKLELVAGTFFVISAITLIGIVINIQQYITDLRRNKKNG